MTESPCYRQNQRRGLLQITVQLCRYNSPGRIRCIIARFA